MSTSTDAIDIELMPGALGATIRGLRLDEPLTGPIHRQLHRALLDHHVLFFPAQGLSPEEHLGAARQIGTVERLSTAPRLAGHDGIIVFDSAAGYEVGDWHADATFLDRPPALSLLQMVRCPLGRGDTLWANLHQAYETLPDGLRDRIGGLVARHVVPRYGSARHPVVAVHPETGRRSLYVFPDFTRTIEGLDRAESCRLLDELFTHSTQEHLLCRHSWREGDMALWDNRSTMHRGVDDFGTSERVIHVIGLNAHRPSAAIKGDASP